MKKFVAVSGQIGVGKSTLVEMLCRKLEWEPFYEPVANNPYIADFYRDMDAWSFHSQIFFLTHRLRIHQQIAGATASVIQDRSIYEDAEVFARNLYLQGHLNERDYSTYRDLYLSLTQSIPSPDLVIYLRASTDTLLKRIALRGRDYEQGISPDYLHQLNELYELWMSTWTLSPVLTVPADSLDFVLNPAHLDLIASKVQIKLTGMEDVFFRADEISAA
ncbi:MAG TPA: deoxynucleoside kinase [Bellilinea sp.]|nr:deoxynucleoside kinase [Bellilinea sp.]